VETRVLLEGYCQTEVHGIPAKKRQVICGTDAEGSKRVRNEVVYAGDLRGSDLGSSWEERLKCRKEGFLAILEEE